MTILVCILSWCNFLLKPDFKIIFFMKLRVQFSLSVMQGIIKFTPLDYLFLSCYFSVSWTKRLQIEILVIKMLRLLLNCSEEKVLIIPELAVREFSQSALALRGMPVPLLVLRQKLSSIELNSTESSWDCSRVGQRASSVRRTTLERVQFALMNVSACSYWI